MLRTLGWACNALVAAGLDEDLDTGLGGGLAGGLDQGLDQGLGEGLDAAGWDESCLSEGGTGPPGHSALILAHAERWLRLADACDAAFDCTRAALEGGERRYILRDSNYLRAVLLYVRAPRRRMRRRIRLRASSTQGWRAQARSSVWNHIRQVRNSGSWDHMRKARSSG